MAKKLRAGWFPVDGHLRDKKKRHFFPENDAWSLCKDWHFDSRKPEFEDASIKDSMKCKKCEGLMPTGGRDDQS